MKTYTEFYFGIGLGITRIDGDTLIILPFIFDLNSKTINKTTMNQLGVGSIGFLIIIWIMAQCTQPDIKPNKVCYTCHETKVASTKHSAIVGDSYITVCGLKTDSLYFTEERMLNDSTTYWHEWSCVKKEQ